MNNILASLYLLVGSRSNVRESVVQRFHFNILVNILGFAGLGFIHRLYKSLRAIYFNGSI